MDTKLTEVNAWRHDFELYEHVQDVMERNFLITAIRDIRTKYRHVGLKEARDYAVAVGQGYEFPINPPIEAPEPDIKVKVITAAKLVENLGEWAMLKDTGKINLLWKDDHIDGIGQVTPDGYMIQYGGIVNEPDYVTGDTLIQIEWLSTKAATEPSDPLAAEVERLSKVIEDGRKFLKESVEPLRQLAMDISLKYEPCGYYCDPDEWGGGHHDHKLFNHAKYLFGSGLVDYLPIDLDPFPERRADQETGRF